VLAMPETMLNGPGVIADLLKSLDEAAVWCDTRENHGTLAELLGRPEYLDMDPALIIQSLSGTLPIASPVDQTDFLYFSRHDANRPQLNEALWLYAQMRRWGQAPANHSDEHAVRSVFRRGYYESVLGVGDDSAEPSVLACDDVVFQGNTVNDYLSRFVVSTIP